MNIKLIETNLKIKSKELVTLKYAKENDVLIPTYVRDLNENTLGVLEYTTFGTRKSICFYPVRLQDSNNSKTFDLLLEE